MLNQRRFRGGAIGALPSPLDEWSLWFSGGFWAPMGPLAFKEKMYAPPPGQIPEYVPA